MAASTADTERIAVAPTADTERIAYSPAEVAAAVGCSRQHIQNMIRDGKLPSVKLGRKRLIPRTVLDDLVNPERQAS